MSSRHMLMRPRPDDFETHAAVETHQMLCKRYKAGPDTVIRWRRECGVYQTAHTAGAPAIPMPEDFARVQGAMTGQQMADKYGVSRSTITRWLRSIGRTRPQGGDRRPSQPAPRSKAPNRAILPGFRQAPDVNRRDTSAVGRAADFMRRDRPVFRCNDQGQQSQDGSFWMCGRVRLTDAELIERAEAKGFQAWSVAA